MNSAFNFRHNGPGKTAVQEMLKTTGAATMDGLISETIPDSIRLTEPLKTGNNLEEQAYLAHVKSLSLKNKLFKNYIGCGYYDTHTPSVILRNIFENPGWYTAYTPYQAEIAQGRLEALLNFQTMVMDLTGMEIANASLLDESTAAAEAMTMFYHQRNGNEGKKFFVADDVFPQTIGVLKTRANPIGIKIVVGPIASFNPDGGFFGMLLQYPGLTGTVSDFGPVCAQAIANNIQVAVAADLLSLAILTPPGEWGADAVVGTTQRFGIPMGYGGPHAAYFAVKEKYKRVIPGRIIGVSQDAKGNRALRMALQTREQHIRREKATSNICTSQVLLAVMAGMYGVYHGPEGLKSIANGIHQLAVSLAVSLHKNGYAIRHKNFFDTLCVETPAGNSSIKKLALKKGLNFFYPDKTSVCISLDETTKDQNLNEILSAFPLSSEQPEREITFHSGTKRAGLFMQHAVFNTHHSETSMMRYIKKLENKDLSLVHSMIPLGSCTMKLNAATEMIPLSWAHFAKIHPFAPAKQAAGYLSIITELEQLLCNITGFNAVSFQPNSGAQGEYAGLMVIRAYHHNRKEKTRTVVLIPSSAHGTNPATAVMCGMQVIVVACDAAGNIDVNDLKQKAEANKETLCALMVTYPSTHGVFETSIREITQIIHENGGLVYMDGANMNAQVGLTNPGAIGADVCHLNLHKTFAIPHGGGGPGAGPIAVSEKLAPFLPSHPMVKTGGKYGITPVSSAPFGSASILLISYGYIKMLGQNGLREATETAILNANYLKVRLQEHFPVLYTGSTGRVAHEMILDCRAFKRFGIEVEDIAKRLMDYGFHAPTVSFPVAGTLMIEPTESENKEELDRFCDAMISIRSEIEAVMVGTAPSVGNILKNAPHTAAEAMSDQWNHPYSREQALFPLSWVRENKYFPPVSRVDNAYGDRNLVCACPPVEEYSETIPG